MRTLIIKLGATGDVVRTTPLLQRFEGPVTWLTASKNAELLTGVQRTPALEVIDWEHRFDLKQREFDLVVSLEDEIEVARTLDLVRAERVFGAYRTADDTVSYTEDAAGWFDLSLVSSYGCQKADELKLQNRHTYQHLIFSGLGLEFTGEPYLLPATPASPLRGDVAIAPEAGSVWPMKKWAHYDWLRTELEQRGLTVNYLPLRPTLLEHLADVRAHRCLVSGDSLPMHFAIGSGIPSIALFNCTSPWEIHDYGILTKIVSPLLPEFFYKRGLDVRATCAIDRETVLHAVLQGIESTTKEFATRS